MTHKSLETDLAVKALARRLFDWGVTDNPATKARLYIDELTMRGWKPDFVNVSRRPPRRDEECRLHVGEYAPPNCRCCHADKRAAREADGEVRVAQERRSVEEHAQAARDAIRAARTAQPPQHPTPTRTARATTAEETA